MNFKVKEQEYSYLVMRSIISLCQGRVIMYSTFTYHVLLSFARRDSSETSGVVRRHRIITSRETLNVVVIIINDYVNSHN